ncbi:MAG: glycosyltransferase [bacterium]
MKTKIIIDPTTNILFSSFYIKGLYDLFGKRNVHFAYSMEFFKELKRKNVSFSFDQYLAFVIIEDKKIFRVIIDYRDSSNIEERAYNWCNIYAKINLNIELTNPIFLSKIINIPPGFAINLWGFWKTMFFCFRNIIFSGLILPTTFKTHLSYYYYQFKRPNIEELHFKSKSKKDYVFFNSTLWRNKSTLLTTNVWRKKFVEECLSNENIKFEGGFYAKQTHPDYENYKNFSFPKKIKSNEYFSKTKKSALVFNTPAVMDCHGWKLGEFMAMGKAIISTPLKNKIPFGLVHGENVHFIESKSKIKPAINKIISDDEYKKKLEEGAFKYFHNYATPKNVIKQVYDSLDKQ